MRPVTDETFPDISAIQFHELCLWLERTFPQPGGIGSTVGPRGETVRFRANPSLSFPPEEIAAIEPPRNDRAPVVVTTNLFGLHGPSSPLPPSLTERVVLADDGGALRDFLDLFNHRLLSLLFVVWKHYRHHLRYQSGASDPISGAVAALFGMLTVDARTARPLLMPYAGILALSNRSATMLASIIGDFFKIPCRVDEFVAREIRLPDDAIWRLGTNAGILGRDTLAGECMQDASGKFRVRLGPLSAVRCDQFLPRGKDHQTLIELIQLAIRDPLDWEMTLLLQAEDAVPFVLGEARLGWLGWLGSVDQTMVEFSVRS